MSLSLGPVLRRGRAEVRIKVLVDTLAYLETIKPPKTLRPRKNVVIRVCNDTVGAWSRPFTPARQLRVAEIVKQWSA